MEGGFSDLILKEFEMNPWTIYTSYHVDRCTFIESGVILIVKIKRKISRNLQR